MCDYSFVFYYFFKYNTSTRFIKLLLNMAKNTLKLPKKITPCPIVESVVEIRFDSAIPPDAIFGVVYNSFNKIFPNKPENLPILQVPAQIRNNDPNLLYQPHYRLSNDTFLFQVGPKSISLINKGEYIGWSVFSPKIIECFQKIKKIQIIKNTKRFGLRYINFFEKPNIYNEINLKLVLNKEPLTDNKTAIRISLPKGEFTITLQVSNDSKIKHNDTKKLGSTIDIDVFLEEDGSSIIDRFDSILEDMHNKEKELFFSLLKEEFLIKFNPEY